MLRQYIYLCINYDTQLNVEDEGGFSSIQPQDWESYSGINLCPSDVYLNQSYSSMTRGLGYTDQKNILLSVYFCLCVSLLR